MGLMDSISSGLDRLGERAVQAMDEGRLRMDLMRARRRRDNAARDLGMLVYRESKGASPMEGEVEALKKRIGDSEAEVERLEDDIRRLREKCAGSGSGGDEGHQRGGSER